MRNLKSIFIGLFFATLVLLAITIAVGYFYEDEVSQYLIEELNESLLTEVEVEDLNFSLIKKFPKASLELKNVVAFSKEGFYKEIKGYNTDTLFFAQSIYIQMNMMDLITKDLKISSIHFDRGDIRLFIDHLGDPNYIFWKTDSTKNKNNEFRLKLSEVKVTRSSLLYCNNSTNLLLRSKIDRIDFEGDFSRDSYLMKIKADQFIERLNIEEMDYVLNKDVKAKLGLDIVSDQIKLNNGSLKLEGLNFGINGNIQKSGNKKIDLLISGKNLNLNSFIKNLPPKIIAEFPNIIGQKGTATLNLNVSGENLKVNKPHLDALFILNNAQLFDLEREIRLSNVNIDGEFSNGLQNNAKTSSLIFKNFEARMEGSLFKGSFQLANFKDPKIKLDLSSEIYLDEIHEIFHIDTLDIMEGVAKSRLIYNGNYKELRAFTFRDLFTQDYDVNLQLSNGRLKFKNQALVLKEISGNIDLRKTLYTDSLFFKVKDNDFLLKGRISKLFEYFNEEEVFNINARLHSRKINLNELAALFKRDKPNQEEEYRFPDKIALQLRLDIDNFEVGKFYATQIRGNLNYKPKMFSLHEISFNSMNGDVKAGGVIIQKFNNDFLVRTQSRLNNINMNKLFYSFNNFGQSFISNNNLEGNLTGDVYFASEFSDQLKIYKNSISSESEINITNGELNYFEPMMSLSRFIDIEDLEKVKFSTIKNTITIKDEQMILPQMDIESSALNLTASGTHQFNGKYEYHVNMLLSDILSGKMKKRKNRRRANENIEEDEEGRMRLFLLVEGDKDKNNVRYDREAARMQRKAGLKNEKNELKQILNEEYGWYEEDTSIKINHKTEEGFQIEFEEDEKKGTKNKKKSKDTEQEQKFVIEWEEDTSNIKVD